MSTVTTVGLFKVEMKFASGWADAEWTIDGDPMRFDTEGDANMEIDEHIYASAEAHARGDLDSLTTRADYRVVPVEPLS